MRLPHPNAHALKSLQRVTEAAAAPSVAGAAASAEEHLEGMSVVVASGDIWQRAGWHSPVVPAATVAS